MYLVKITEKVLDKSFLSLTLYFKVLFMENEAEYLETLDEILPLMGLPKTLKNLVQMNQ
jgi:hypothetical protein